MKRKISKIGPSTLMISLPSKWAKQNHIKKGDELDIFEKQEGLFITGKGKNIKEEVSIDVTKLETTTLVHYVILNLFMSGFKKMRIKYKPTSSKYIHTRKKEINTFIAIENLVKCLIGTEITEDKPGMCVIEEIADVDSSSFKNTFRRGFLLLLENAECVKNSSAKNFDNTEYASEFTIKYYNAGKFLRYATKLLRTANIPIKERERYILLINNLKLIGSSYAKIAELKGKRNISIKLLTKVNKVLRDYYEQLFDPKYEGINKLSKSVNDLQVEIYKQKDQDLLFNIIHILKHSTVCLPLAKLLKIKYE